MSDEFLERGRRWNGSVTLSWWGIAARINAYICIEMIDMARTTLNLEDRLLAEAKALAASEHTSLTRLVERGLAMQLRASRKPGGQARERPRLPVHAGRGGLQPEIADPRRQRDLLDAADGLS